MKIGFVRVFVSDFEKSLEFYTEKLGMELEYTDHSNWAQFVSGNDVSLAIEKCASDQVEQGSRLVGRFVGVTLMVDDITEQFELLTKKMGVKFSVDVLSALKDGRFLGLSSSLLNFSTGEYGAPRRQNVFRRI